MAFRPQRHPPVFISDYECDSNPAYGVVKSRTNDHGQTSTQPENDASQYGPRRTDNFAYEYNYPDSATPPLRIALADTVSYSYCIMA